MTSRTAGAEKFRNLSRIAKLIQDSHDLDEVLRKLTEGVCLNSIWDFSTIQVLDLASGRTIPIIRYNPFIADLRTLPQYWEAAGSPIMSVVQTGRPVVIRDASDQDDYQAFREDARQRGYHSVVIIPLKFPDRHGRAQTFSVLSHRIVEVDDAEMSYLQCLADLADIAVRRMLKLAEETEAADAVRQVLHNLNAALANSLNAGMTEELFSTIGKLIPTAWFALDLTTGGILCDEAAQDPELQSLVRREAFALMRLARQARGRNDDTDVTLDNEGTAVRLRVRGLAIDGEIVGGLFLVSPNQVEPQDWRSVEAAHMALSTFILRNHTRFRSRTMVERRALQQLFFRSSGPREIAAEFRFLGIDLMVPRRILVLQTTDEEFPADLHSYILRKAEGAFGAALSLLDGNRLSLLLNDGPALSDPKVRMAFLRSIQPTWNRAFTLTLSERVSQAESYPDVWAYCCRVLDVAAAMKAEGWITGKKIGYFPQLMASVPQSVADSLLERTILPLLEDGSDKGRASLETLGTYLSTGRRLQETADQLGIHVSTLRYRLQRITERFGLDLTDSETCFELDLAMRLYALKSSYQT